MTQTPKSKSRRSKFCPVCGGNGVVAQVFELTCNECAGTGRIFTRRVVRRRRRRKADIEYAVDKSYQQVHADIVAYGRREAMRTLLRLAPKLSKRDARYIVRRIAEGKHVGAKTVKLTLLVRYWYGSANDVVKVISKKLRKGVMYDLRVEG